MFEFVVNTHPLLVELNQTDLSLYSALRRGTLPETGPLKDT